MDSVGRTALVLVRALASLGCAVLCVCVFLCGDPLLASLVGCFWVRPWLQPTGLCIGDLQEGCQRHGVRQHQSCLGGCVSQVRGAHPVGVRMPMSMRNARFAVFCLSSDVFPCEWPKLPWRDWHKTFVIFMFGFVLAFVHSHLQVHVLDPCSCCVGTWLVVGVRH